MSGETSPQCRETNSHIGLANIRVIYLSVQEAFFGKQLMDLSKKALLVTPGQRHHGAMGLLRPPLPHARGARPTAPDAMEVRERAMGAGMHLKQEGGEGSQPQGEGAGSSSTVKEPSSTDPQGSDTEKNEGKEITVMLKCCRLIKGILDQPSVQELLFFG